jgi:hypothetical protein
VFGILGNCSSKRRFNHVYKYSPYNEPLVTLNRATNIEDSLYSDASSDGYSAVISVSQVAKDIEDGLVGYVSRLGSSILAQY